MFPHSLQDLPAAVQTFAKCDKLAGYNLHRLSAIGCDDDVTFEDVANFRFVVKPAKVAFSFSQTGQWCTPMAFNFSAVGFSTTIKLLAVITLSVNPELKVFFRFREA